MVEDKMPLRDAFLAAQRHLRDEGYRLITGPGLFY